MKRIAWLVGLAVFLSVFTSCRAAEENPLKALDGLIGGMAQGMQRQCAEQVREILASGGDINKPYKGTTALYSAVASHDIRLVKLVLSRGADPNVVPPGGMPVLHVAAMSTDWPKEIAEALIVAKADVNARDATGQTALHVTVDMSGREEIVDLLLASRADPNALDRDGRTPLHVAAGRSNAEMIKLLVKAGAKPSVGDKEGMTPLHFACAEIGTGAAAVAEALLEGGADVKQQDAAGWTALHFAANHGQADAIGVLLKWKADVNVRDKKGWSPLMLAADMAQHEAQGVLRKAGAKEESWTPAFEAAIANDADAVKRELAAGANVNAKDRIGRTPLLWASAVGSEDAAKMLLDAKADVNAKEASGATALHGAARSGSDNLLKALLAAKADARAKDDEGMTPLHHAAERNDAVAVRMLLAAGADVNAKNAKGATPLHVFLEANTGAGSFLRKGEEWAAKPLVEGGADVMAVDGEGRMAEELDSYGQFRDIMAGPVAEAEDARLEKALAMAKGLQPASKMVGDTPANAYRKMMRAVAQGDAAAFRDSLTGPEACRSSMVAGFEFGKAGIEFRRRMIAAYGKDGWVAFAKTRNFRFRMPELDESLLSEDSIRVNGDKATYKHRDAMGRVAEDRLVKEGDIWRIDAESLMPPGAEADALGKFMSSTVAMVKEFEPQIGKPGVTPEGLNKEMGQKLMELMGMKFGD